MARILIVDDSAFIRSKCKRLLQEDDYEVFEAIDGDDGINKVAELAPDVVLLDVVMPKKDGFSACFAIKQTHPEVPIIMVTTKAEKEDIVRGLEYGADDYIVKPFKEAELKARVAAMLRIKSLYDSLNDKNDELATAYKELKTTKDELQEKEKISLVGQFMVGLHHEIRNPLTAVLANSQILIKHFDLPDEGGNFLKDIEIQARKIRDILDQIKEMEAAEVVDYVDGTKMIKIANKEEKSV